MSGLRPLALIMFTSLVFMNVSRTAAECDSQCKAKKLIVKVTCQLNGSTSTGSGIIVGAKNNSIYIVTAKHVVFEGLHPASDLKVAFSFSRPGEFVSANLLYFDNQGMDISLLSVDNDNKLNIDFDSLPWNMIGKAGLVNEGSRVYVLGGDWKPSSDPEYLESRVNTRITVQTKWVFSGDSGGGIFSENWKLIGMIVKEASPKAYGYSIESIGELLSSSEIVDMDYGPIRKDSGLSLKDTLSFIHDKFKYGGYDKEIKPDTTNKYTWYNVTVSYQFNSDENEPCMVTIIEEKKFTYPHREQANYTETVTYKYHLADMFKGNRGFRANRPGEVEGMPIYSEIIKKTRDYAGKITTEKIPLRPGNDFTLSFEARPDIAREFKNAFKYGIKLCEEKRSERP